MSPAALGADELATPRAVESRVRWLATRMVDSANHDRFNADGVQVGGRQASSASLVSITTALWFTHLRSEDRVGVKPHASPALQAINYLPADQLTGLRTPLVPWAYPSQTKTRTGSTSRAGRSASGRRPCSSPRPPVATSTRTSASAQALASSHTQHRHVGFGAAAVVNATLVEVD